MRGFISEFKEFIARGNVIDLAVGVVIGGAFSKIVSSLVADVILPLTNPITGTVKFNDLHLGAVNIGNFIEATIDFLIVSFVIFLVIKALSKFKKKEEKKEDPVIPNQEKLLIEIRDLLKNATISSH